jgi:hypothetical protein
MIMPQLKYEQKKKVIQAAVFDSFMGCDLGYICGGAIISEKSVNEN